MDLAAGEAFNISIKMESVDTATEVMERQEKGKSDENRRPRLCERRHQRQTITKKLTFGPVLFALTSICATQTRCSAITSDGSTPPAAGFGWQMVDKNLARELSPSRSTLAPARLASGQYQNRWVNLGSSSSQSAGSRPLLNLWDRSRRPPSAQAQSRPALQADRRTMFLRALNQLRARVGERNSIRVHNAFRDFAWRLLSSLSMPTPVIYELRRQHLYSPDEDAKNDRFWNRNTTKTIRTRRELVEGLPQHEKLQDNRRQLSDGDEDDDDYDSDSRFARFRERLRSRLDDLFSLSRRSLFGRVIRVPSLLPFKRQESSGTGDQADRRPNGSTHGRGLRRLRLSFRSSRRRRTEPEHQMININGKQYFVDDDGELKELKTKSNPERRVATEAGLTH